MPTPRVNERKFAPGSFGAGATERGALADAAGRGNSGWRRPDVTGWVNISLRRVRFAPGGRAHVFVSVAPGRERGGGLPRSAGDRISQGEWSLKRRRKIRENLDDRSGGCRYAARPPGLDAECVGPGAALSNDDVDDLPESTRRRTAEMMTTTATRMAIGDVVVFQTNTGRDATGTVVELITERRQPTLVLIEREDGGRAIRLEHEVRLVNEPAAALAG